MGIGLFANLTPHSDRARAPPAIREPPHRDPPAGTAAGGTAFDATAKAMSGAMRLTGFPGNPPLKATVPYVDLGAGALAALGVMFALYHRTNTGEGQFIDISLLDTAATFAQYVGAAALYGVHGELREQLGNYGFAPFSISTTNTGTNINDF